jgi:hypothetical protein
MIIPIYSKRVLAIARSAFPRRGIGAAKNRTKWHVLFQSGIFCYNPVRYAVMPLVAPTDSITV